MKTSITLAASMLMLPVAWGQDEPLEEAEEIRRYSVEIVVFRYAEDVAVGTEVFPPDMPNIPEDEEFADDPTRTKIDADSKSRMTPVERVLMREQDFTMQDIIERLRRLDAYQTMMHIGWTQPTYPSNETRPIDISYFRKPLHGLSGSFELYLDRYLHLVVDLALDAPGQKRSSPLINEPNYSFGDSRQGSESDSTMHAGPVRYRIQENRIFKNSDIRYFDHPKFGVIAKIMRIEPEQGEPTEIQDLELIGGFRQ